MSATPDTFNSLFWAYTLIWLILAIYIFRLGRKVKKLERACAERDQRSQV